MRKNTYKMKDASGNTTYFCGLQKVRFKGFDFQIAHEDVESMLWNT